jgi:hypothetical protein
VCGDGTGGSMLWDVRGECEGDGGTEYGGADSDSDWYRYIECDILCVFSVCRQ